MNWWLPFSLKEPWCRAPSDADPPTAGEPQCQALEHRNRRHSHAIPEHRTGIANQSVARPNDACDRRCEPPSRLVRQLKANYLRIDVRGRALSRSDERHHLIFRRVTRLYAVPPLDRRTALSAQKNEHDDQLGHRLLPCDMVAPFWHQAINRTIVSLAGFPSLRPAHHLPSPDSAIPRIAVRLGACGHTHRRTCALRPAAAHQRMTSWQTG